MKKIIVLLLVGLMMLSSTALVFAEETERVELSEEQRREKAIEVFELYNPDALVVFNEVNDAHKAFHEASRTERDILKEERTAAREAIKTMAKDGELTREEVKVIIEEAKAEIESFRAMVDPILEEKKAAVAANKEEMVVVRTAIREALQAEVIDEAYVASLLEQTVTLLQAHLDIDEYYYDMIHNLVPAI